ncbi:MAG: phosphoribosylanthranilate isomerase [Lachnospiraceae bacterium]|nr:phosphoribosylanthranilate isomerase [Lachnospiraceae bacterium]
MPEIKVKICGLSRITDIEAVNNEKPDYIGFVFAESKRKITPEKAAELRSLLSPKILSVGVFVNEAMEKIISLYQNNVINIIQLHGQENEQYIKELKSLTNAPIIKAVSIKLKGDAQKYNNSSADYLLLDHLSGGTGQTFNWDLIGETGKPYFLAGGLNINNVREAILKTNLFAVDVSSGVETNGFKDAAKIKDFMEVINEYR